MLPCVVIDLFLNNQQDALIIQIYSVIKLYVFRASPLPVIRNFLLYIRHWEVSCRFLMTASKQSQDGTAFHPDSAWKRSSKTCMKLTSVECTAENSWWWAEKMPETCRVLRQNKLRSILTLLGSGHQKPAWNLPVSNVQQKTPDDGQRRCPKHVEFYNRINCVPSWLCLEAVIKNLHETYQCRMYSRKLLMTGREDARNM